MQNALAGASRIFEILDTEPDVKERQNPVHLAKVEGKIRFENVSFRFKEKEAVQGKLHPEAR